MLCFELLLKIVFQFEFGSNPKNVQSRQAQVLEGGGGGVETG